MRNRSFFVLSIAALVMIFAISCTNDPALPEYVVSFDSAGGSEVSPITVKDGGMAAKPADPVKNGYLFVGWYLGDDIYYFDTPVKGSIQLKAVWGKTVNTEAELKAAISDDNESLIILADDITVSSTIIINGSNHKTLDLNGKTISNAEDIWVSSNNNWSLISVRGYSNLLIKGEGTLKAKENDCYALDVQDKTAGLVIENGEFVGNIHAVYVCEGTLSVNGGTFSVQQKYPDAAKADDFVLNCLDEAYKANIAKITVSGGKFLKFNPASCWAEGEGTDFLAKGYKSVAEGDYFKVIAE